MVQICFHIIISKRAGRGEDVVFQENFGLAFFGKLKQKEGFFSETADQRGESAALSAVFGGSSSPDESGT